MNKLLALVVSLGLLMFMSGVAVAQEITPEPGTYDFGATSEYSVSRQIGESSGASSGNDNLADTGQSSVAPLVVAGAILLVGSIVLVSRSRKHLVNR